MYTGGTGTGLLAYVSQIGFHGPSRTDQVTAQYHYQGSLSGS
jgi:hypothetical protein